MRYTIDPLDPESNQAQHIAIAQGTFDTSALVIDALASW